MMPSKASYCDYLMPTFVSSSYRVSPCTGNESVSVQHPVRAVIPRANLEIQLELLPQVVPDGKVNVMIKNAGANEAERL